MYEAGGAGLVQRAPADHCRLCGGLENEAAPLAP